MHALPFELVTDIAFLACTDGGLTGSVLSQVSRRIRDASHPARFFTVSLASDPERLVKFLAAYDAQRTSFPDIVPRVRHLFLSLLPIEGEPMHRSPPPPFSDIFVAYDKYLSHLRDLGQRYGATICSLISLLAPDLDTFTFVRGEWKDVPAIPQAFPLLRELTLIDGCPEFMHLDSAPLAHPPLFPALQRLHFIQFFYTRPVDLTRWAPHAPALTHLRNSGLRHSETPTVDSLKTVSTSRPPVSTSEDDIDSAIFFPHLQHVLVQPAAPKLNLAYLLQGQRVLGADLAVCAEEARRVGIRFDVLPSHDPLKDLGRRDGAAREVLSAGAGRGKESAPERCIRLAREEWLARAVGGLGCWSGDYVV